MGGAETHHPTHSYISSLASHWIYSCLTMKLVGCHPCTEFLVPLCEGTMIWASWDEPVVELQQEEFRVSQWIEENTYSFMNGIHLPASSGGAAGQTGKSPRLAVSRCVFLRLQSVQGGPGWGPDGNPSPLLPCSHRTHRQRQSFHGWPSLMQPS